MRTRALRAIGGNRRNVSHPEPRHASTAATGTPVAISEYEWVVNSAPKDRWPALQLREFWTHGELIYFFAVRDVKVRYKQAFLGIAWAAIQPIAGAVMFTILFNRLADIDIDGASYFAFALLGFGVWTYFSSTLQAGTVSLVYNSELLTKVAFPRIVPPTAALLPALMDLGVALLLATSISIAQGGRPDAIGVLVGLPLGFVLLVLAVVGPVLFLSATLVKYRDAATLVSFMLQLLLFASPVAYPPELVPDPWQTILYLNPISGVLGSLRAALIGTDLPSAAQLLLSVTVAVAMSYVGLMHFRRSEREFADII
jgi:lipopolysaccharide transport system permease protein